MLIIRDEQMLVLAQAQKDRFKADFAGELAASHLAVLGALDATAVRALVDAGVVRAVAHGIDSEDGIRRYVRLMVDRGVGFEDEPGYAWARCLLDRRDLPGDVRVDQLEKMVALLGRS